MATYEYRMVGRKLSDNTAPTINNPKEISEYLLANCYTPEEMWREKAFAVFLNKSNRITGHILLSMGGLSSTPIDIRVLIKSALDTMACSVILTHNHPSGDPRPSSDDINQTTKVKNALRVFDMNLLDHIIVGDDTFFSFNDEKIYPTKP